MAVHPGDEERPTVDLGPRPDTDGADPGDLGPDDDPGALIEPTRTLTPGVNIHALSTQKLTPRPPADSATKYPTATSHVDAMRLEEIQRARVFLRVALLTCVAGFAVSLLAPGDPIAFRVIAVGCLVTAIGAGWMLSKVRSLETYSSKSIFGPALVVALGAFGGVYYWGVASPVAAMITYGIYFFSLGSNVTVITAMYALVSTIHGVLGLLIVGGVLQYRGIVKMGGTPWLDQLGILAVIEFLYFITFYTARVSQRVTLEAVQHLETAVRGVAQREALLAEARAELDRALKIGGPGRFTDQTVGSYHLGVLIGRGGMGEVYEAKNTVTNQEAAVKLLHPGTLADSTHVARFIREAETVVKLDTPYVVRVLEVGTTSGEVPFLAMERLRGYDLAHQLRRQRRLQLPQAKALVTQIAQGLEAARAAGIVHRDLKPHNVFFSQQAETWKILDFGVSKVGGTGTLTKGHVVGTPAYMAPEQAKGESVDHRADVYSLAAILYRAVTGHPAFASKDVPTTLYDAVYRVPTQPSILAPVPGDVDRVLALGLAKRPDERFQTALEMAEWFALAIDDQLSPEQRRRADELATKHPWGTRQL
ncbi:MAG TPA: serine/threonine-protein kinase [Kofleriaceae bacterium]